MDYLIVLSSSIIHVIQYLSGNDHESSNRNTPIHDNMGGQTIRILV
jgi:hypothetical protein